MLPTLQIFPRLLLAAALAAPLAITACQQAPAPAPAATPAATPAPASTSDDAAYRQWERDTKREHRELVQRTEEEKRQYNDWRREHEHH